MICLPADIKYNGLEGLATYRWSRAGNLRLLIGWIGYGGFAIGVMPFWDQEVEEGAGEYIYLHFDILTYLYEARIPGCRDIDGCRSS
jgi:hypothetical protein